MLAQTSSMVTDTLITVKNGAPELADQALPNPRVAQAKA